MYTNSCYSCAHKFIRALAMFHIINFFQRPVVLLVVDRIQSLMAYFKALNFISKCMWFQHMKSFRAWDIQRWTGLIGVGRRHSAAQPAPWQLEKGRWSSIFSIGFLRLWSILEALIQGILTWSSDLSNKPRNFQFSQPPIKLQTDLFFLT